MLFNSFAFAVFFIIVFFIYWYVGTKSLKIQNLLLCLASFYFYSCWNWKFLFLLLFSTLLDYYSGIKIENSNNIKHKKYWLILSVCINIGLLGFFKYYNFFIESFSDLIRSFGFTPHLSTLNIILPVGISFYTFHGMSYVFDIYNKKMLPTKNFINYSLFVSFFPLLVAGPIERARHLLPQVEKSRVFDYNNATSGLKQILWGLFKKVVIADNCATIVDNIFNNYGELSGSTRIIGAIYFAFQIYGDFSGYTDIALGTARLLGFELLKNFSYPYFSRDIAEFWRRWHISLSSWFRDYLYIPLGGSKGSTWMKIRNTFIIFLVSGFWHGANWTFLFWGFLHALFFLPLLLAKKNRNNLETVAQNTYLPNIKEFAQMFSTFALVVFAWIFFRADSISQSFSYISGIFSYSTFSMPQFINIKLIFFIVILVIIEWLGRNDNFGLEHLAWRWYIKYPFYYFIIIAILWFSGKAHPFIYFQF